ncbi:hypothetical protein N7457_008958 [Penicillium paradoxum]|uniref:uncharacterized protein n=1 Tax=Penicillium paradoxum TaxID=176176 RepID=UPI0025490EAD|nr:uncharacterized protein N7457_008958 [Penicillium paradoxum]KAJ5774062.1 hypothetical protein N7457_008958 [Penicillium paradoxum]
MSLSSEDQREFSTRRIIRIAKDKLLKYGPSEDIELEAENMRYIAESTTIPIPRIHEIQTHDDNIKSISMDYIEGQTLQDAWPSMIPSQKMLVAQELHGYISQLRALSPEYLGSSGDGKIYMRHPASFDEYLLSRMATSVPGSERDYIPAKRLGGRMVFTHGDLAPRNILVDDHGHVTAILDWEFAGWHPEWWETVRAYTFCNDVPGWTAYLSAIFPPDHATEYMAVAFARHMSR